MRLVQLDDRVVVDADRVEALVQQHYENPQPIDKVDVYLRGKDIVSVVGTLTGVMDKLRSALAVGE